MKRQGLSRKFQELFDWLWLSLTRPRLLPLALLSFAVFWPALDNGFISDDFIFLDRVEAWSENPGYLFTIPPENFRTTTYLAFLVLKRLFGYQAGMFYVFTILVHAVNAFLLGRLIGRLTGDAEAGGLTSLLFVSFQNPQEAIMWLGGMNEDLLGLSLLGLLNLWAAGFVRTSAGVYCVALFSKESAPIGIPLVLLSDAWRGCRHWLRSSLLYLVVPSIFFSLLFLYLVRSNSLIAGGFYAFGSGALVVLLKSLHSLAFPWLYLVIGLTFGIRRRLDFNNLRWTLGWMVIGLLPYLFLTYQDHVPSRHEYLGAMGAAAAIALCLRQIDRKKVTVLFLVLYVVGNAGYIALRKDAQFEERAAPTSLLIQELERRTPEPLLLEGFPLNPWIARMTTRVVDGWEPDLIRMEPEGCDGCVRLRWDGTSRTYLPDEGR